MFSVAKDGLPKALQTLPGVYASTDLTTPMFVLVNENTASAAEVLSAALQVTQKLYLSRHIKLLFIHFINCIRKMNELN